MGVVGQGQGDRHFGACDPCEPGPCCWQLDSFAGHRRLGARLLLAVSESQGRVLQRHLERHQLEDRGKEVPGIDVKQRYQIHIGRWGDEEHLPEVAGDCMLMFERRLYIATSSV